MLRLGGIGNASKRRRNISGVKVDPDNGSVERYFCLLRRSIAETNLFERNWVRYCLDKQAIGNVSPILLHSSVTARNNELLSVFVFELRFRFRTLFSFSNDDAPRPPRWRSRATRGM